MRWEASLSDKKVFCVTIRKNDIQHSLPRSPSLSQGPPLSDPLFLKHRHPTSSRSIDRNGFIINFYFPSSRDVDSDEGMLRFLLTIDNEPSGVYAENFSPFHSSCACFHPRRLTLHQAGDSKAQIDKFPWTASPLSSIMSNSFNSSRASCAVLWIQSTRNWSRKLRRTHLRCVIRDRGYFESSLNAWEIRFNFATTETDEKSLNFLYCQSSGRVLELLEDFRPLKMIKRRFEVFSLLDINGSLGRVYFLINHKTQFHRNTFLLRNPCSERVTPPSSRIALYWNFRRRFERFLLEILQVSFQHDSLGIPVKLQPNDSIPRRVEALNFYCLCSTRNKRPGDFRLFISWREQLSVSINSFISVQPSKRIFVNSRNALSTAFDASVHVVNEKLSI